jgi:NAD(P)H-hydrate epimerase
MEVTSLTKELAAALIRHRQPESHKGNYGHALIIAGNTGRMGAAVLAAMSCVRTGAGLTSIYIPFDERSILQTAVPEAMLLFREREWPEAGSLTAAGIGPALGLQPGNEQLLEQALQTFRCPLVLDADALTLLSRHPWLLEKVPAQTIFTPHPKEFDRLFGECRSSEQRMSKAIQLAADHNWVMVLKGHQTLVASRDGCTLNTTGNAGLAKGGSGDVLTGMITALLAQGYSSVHAAAAGVYLHGLAADLALQSQSEESLLATDVIAAIGSAYKALR